MPEPGQNRPDAILVAHMIKDVFWEHENQPYISKHSALF